LRDSIRIEKEEREVHMQTSVISRPTADHQSSLAEIPGKNESSLSGVSWAAVIGGAFVSASLALILLSLGTGLGFSSVSPWSNIGMSASTVGKGAVAWLILTQIMAASMGGYLAGRLRTRWTDLHTDEVYFRDTAHGFLVWAVGLVITASLLATAATSLAGGPARRDSAGTTPGAETGMLNPSAYFVDSLLRSNGSVSNGNGNEVAVRGEVDRIFAHALSQGAIPPTDNAYLAQMVSTRSGLTQAEAERRVSDVYGEFQQSTDRSRKALAHLSLWLFVALLSGAFCASFAGTIGGKQRDHVRI
jgi:hypothetical protein